MNQEPKRVGRAGLCFAFLSLVRSLCVEHVLIVLCLAVRSLCFVVFVSRSSSPSCSLRPPPSSFFLSESSLFLFCPQSYDTQRSHPKLQTRWHAALMSRLVPFVHPPFTTSPQAPHHTTRTLASPSPLLSPSLRLPPNVSLSTHISPPPAGAPTSRSRGCPWRTFPKTPGSAGCP